MTRRRKIVIALTLFACTALVVALLVILARVDLDTATKYASILSALAAVPGVAGVIFALLAILTPPLDVLRPGKGRASGAPTSEVSGYLKLLDVRPVEHLTGWSQSEWGGVRRFYLWPQRPPYMSFIRGNDVILPFSELSAGEQEMFELVRAELARREKLRPRGPNHRASTDGFARMSSATFYAASVLRHRLGPKLIASFQGAWYDVRSEISPFRSQPDDLSFYRYDMNAVRWLSANVDELWDGPPPPSTAQAWIEYGRLFMRSNELVLDFVVENAGTSSALLSRLSVAVTDQRMEVTSGPMAQSISVDAQYSVDLHLDQERSEFALDPPLIVPAGVVSRFTVNFGPIPKRPANCVTVRIAFSGNPDLLSPSLELNF